jgi:hypothetical protein
MLTIFGTAREVEKNFEEEKISLSPPDNIILLEEYHTGSMVWGTIEKLPQNISIYILL